jgi:hypothetical protein
MASPTGLEPVPSTTNTRGCEIERGKKALELLDQLTNDFAALHILRVTT